MLINEAIMNILISNDCVMKTVWLGLRVFPQNWFSTSGKQRFLILFLLSLSSALTHSNKQTWRVHVRKCHSWVRSSFSENKIIIFREWKMILWKSAQTKKNRTEIDVVDLPSPRMPWKIIQSLSAQQQTTTDSGNSVKFVNKHIPHETSWNF